METIREDGSWPDVNYNDQKRSGWSVKEHADRVLELAKLYRAEEGDCHWEPKLGIGHSPGIGLLVPGETGL